MQPLPIAVRRLWWGFAIAQSVGALLVLGTLDVVSRRRFDVEWSPWPVLAGPLLVAVAILLIALPVAEVRYRAWGFELTDDWIQARWGVIGRRSATIPRNRVQTLTSENGPIDRLLGLTSVTVHTAGAGAPNLPIPHLDDPTVEWLRWELARGAVD